MKNMLDRIVEKNRHLTKDGKVADYIPALAGASPDELGVCIIDTNGDIYSSGDYSKKFTVQSISKVLSLILAIEDKGEEEVFQKVGMEPTDEPFNSFYKLDLPHGKKPSNPMINSGAIVTTSLVDGEGSKRFNRVLEFAKKAMSNEDLDYNREVYLSEKETGDKNRAMAYLLKNKGLIQGNVEEVLDSYFKQCSIEITCKDIAHLGMYLMKENINRTIIPVMATCGMYDFSGEYAAKVGIPSKSGVGGGIVATVPGKYGIGVYGPALDDHGNSIAGYGVLKDLSKELNLSIFK